MFSFVLSLLVLTAMFTLISGAAFLLRNTLLAGREGMMYPFWVIILLIAIVPLKLNIPVPMPEVPDLPPAEPSAELVYTGDFSEIDRIGELYAVPPTPGAAVHSEETRLAADLRRTLVHIGRYADTIAIVAFILWMSGALFHFIGSMTSYVNTRRLMRLNSVSCHDARLVRLLGECRAAVGLRREVELRLFAVDSLCSPCVCGIVHPTLYLEPGCLKLDDRALSCVLIHELTHIRRYDIAIKLFCLFAAAVHWLNPTSRKVQQALFEDCELACDYSVVRIYGNKISGPYMSTILDFVERFSEGSRLVGQSGTGSGLFISEATGAAFLKRRYANMKNYRKDRLATVITGAFTAVCAAANILALSSCSGITPGALSGAIDLTPPVEQMVRAHYGLSADDFITPEMVDGITSLKVEVNEQYANHILVDFTVNGNGFDTDFYGYARALPLISYQNYFDSTILPAVEEYSEIANETTYVNEKGKLVENTDYQKILAFYQLKDPDEPLLTDRARRELLATFPILEETGPLYYFDPFSSDRERTAIYQILDRAGLIEPWELDSYAFDASSFAYFTNLSEIEFVGLTPVSYDFPESVKVTVNGKDYDTPAASAPEYDQYICEREEYSYAVPTDGSVISIPKNQSLDFAIREYFVMQNWDYAKNPLTSKHLDKITSIKAETDEALTEMLREAGVIEVFDNCRYIRYTINGVTLDIIPRYLAKMDYNGLWQGQEGWNLDVSELIKASYTFDEALGCYVLNEDITDEDKMTIFKAVSTTSLVKVALVDKTDDGVYLTQFGGSSKIGGTPARYLDSVSTFDEADKALFANLTEWEINLK